MEKEIIELVDDYLDRFLVSNHELIKVKDDKYPMNTLKKIFLNRIKERNLHNITSYTFMKELYLEKV
jgi:hypothetical protein